jgi:hypothetical protein
MKDENNLNLARTADCINFVREHLTKTDDALNMLLGHEEISSNLPKSISTKIANLNKDQSLLLNEINLLSSNHAFADVHAIENIMTDLASYTKSAQIIVKELKKLINN